MKQNISEFVKAKRKENKLRQEDLAFYAGVSTKFINELENGKATLRIDKVNDVLRLFNCELGVIIKCEDKNK